jgi:hypothetical protein
MRCCSRRYGLITESKQMEDRVHPWSAQIRRWRMRYLRLLRRHLPISRLAKPAAAPPAAPPDWPESEKTCGCQYPDWPESEKTCGCTAGCATQSNTCPAPKPCTTGQYSIGDAKNGGSDYACRSYEAGKYSGKYSAGKYSAGSSVCTDCVTGKYQGLTAQTSAATCFD